MILSLTERVETAVRVAAAQDQASAAKYLESQYFAHLTADELDFLQKVAGALPRVPVALLDAALGVLLLGREARLCSGVLNSSWWLLDAEREWYRKHPDAADFLRRQVAERDPAAIAGLHGRAAKSVPGARRSRVRPGVRRSQATSSGRRG